MSIGLRDLKTNLIKESSFASYLIYVLGEICLVAVGILVALPFNNIDICGKSRSL